MKTLVITATAVLALGLAGCGSDDTDASPDASAPSSSATGTPSASPTSDGVTVDIDVAADGKVTPQGRRVEVERGEKVTLHITAQAAEEIHVHSDPEHEYEVKAGDDVSESFTIDTPGQVAVEAHHADTVIVQLVVR